MEKVKLSDICNPKQWKAISTSDLLNEGYPVYGANGIIGYYNEYNHENPVVTVTCRGATCGSINITVPKAYVTGNAMCLDDLRSDVEIEYLYYCLKHYDFKNIISGSAQPQITRQGMEKIYIMLCSQEEQKDIVNKLKKTEKIIKLTKQKLQSLDNLIKARFVELFGDPDNNEKSWDIDKMEHLCEVGSSKRIYQNEQSMEGAPFLRISDLVNRIDTGSKKCDSYIPIEKFAELKEQGLVPRPGDILLTARGTLGRCYIVQSDDEFYFQDGMITWLSNYDRRITALYISYLFEMPGFRKQIDALQAGSTVAYMSISMTKKLNIIVPPIELQNQFADFVKQVDKSKVIKLSN